ncbi:uncharacterized protein LOC143033216 [Oratosquilla oratoria]|uniref:uncharacterized protein LOC143033216 n=1 Tax=Oratosquilla oratoria TaxID=337810 RepID=UPI003F75C7B8
MPKLQVVVIAITLVSTVAPLPDIGFSHGHFGLSSVYGAPHGNIREGDEHFLGSGEGDGRDTHARSTSIGVHSRGTSGGLHLTSHSGGSGVARSTPRIFRESTLRRRKAIRGALQGGNFHIGSPLRGNAFGVGASHDGGFDGGSIYGEGAFRPDAVRGVPIHGGSFHGNIAHAIGNQAGSIHRGSAIHSGGSVHGGAVHGYTHGVGPTHGGVSHGAGGGYGGDIIDSYSGPAYYNFDYAVQDEYTNNYYGHSESREGYVTKGKYFVHLPDGRLQTVTYTADEYGFHPVVTYEGTAHYDPPAPVHAGVHGSPVHGDGGHAKGAFTTPVHGGSHAGGALTNPVHGGVYSGGAFNNPVHGGGGGGHLGVHAESFAGGIHPGDVYLRGVHPGIGYPSSVYNTFS